MKKRTRIAFLICILLIAILLRFYNLSNTDFLVDESLNYHNAKLILEQGKNPIELINGEQPPVFLSLDAMSAFFFGANEFSMRFVSALFGVFTVLLVYFFAKELSTEKAALSAGLLIAVMPIHVIFSRISFSDVTVSFFLLLSIYLAQRAWKGKGTYLMPALSGLVFGLAFMTKFNAIIVWGLYWIYIFFTRWKKLPWKEFLIVHAAALLSFVTLTGFSGHRMVLLAYNVVAWSVAVTVGKTHPITFYFFSLFDGLSPLMFLSFLAIVCYAIYEFLWKKKERTNDRLLIILCLAYLVIIALQQRRYAKYLTMVVPFIAIIVSIRLTKWFKNGWKIVIILLALSSLTMTIYEINRYNGMHIWANTGEYIAEKIPPNSTIHISPYYEYPLTFYIDNEFGNLQWAKHYERGTYKSLLINNRLNTSQISTGDFVILADAIEEPFDDNLLLYHSKTSTYPKEYVDFVVTNGAIKQEFNSKGHFVIVYNITSALKGNLDFPSAGKPSAIACKFKNLIKLFDKELFSRLKDC